MTYLFGEAVSHAVLISSLSPKMSLFLFVSKFFLLYSLTIDRPTESMRNSKTVVVFITLLLWDFFFVCHQHRSWEAESTGDARNKEQAKSFSGCRT